MGGDSVHCDRRRCERARQPWWSPPIVLGVIEVITILMVTGGAAVLFYAIHCMRQPLRFCKHTLHSVEEHHTCLKYLKNSTKHWISLRSRPIWFTACEFERIVVLQRKSLRKCISRVQCTVRETLNWPLEEVGVWWIDQEALGHHSSPLLPALLSCTVRCALIQDTAIHWICFNYEVTFLLIFTVSISWHFF